MGAFEYRQAQEVRDTFARHGVRYLFIGKSGAILLGFPDTTQDADLFVQRSEENCRALLTGLRELGFSLTEPQAAEVLRGKDFIQLRNGPFDLDLAAHKLYRNGVDVELTAKEFKLLAYFASRRGCALARNDVLDAVWGASVIVTPRSIDRCVATLRGKIEPDPHNSTYIQTIRDIGYRFDAE